MDQNLERELSDAAGETHWRRVAPFELNEVSLNGSGEVSEIAPGKFERKGGFFRKRILVGRRNRNEKPEEIDLGKTVRIVFLRKRRRLVERGGTDGKILRATNEHDIPSDVVTLYDSLTEKSESGVAKDLRIKYGALRTVEIIYALLITDANQPELVRIPVRGASLGSEAKAETTTDLYRYIGSFAGSDHIWQSYTVLYPVLEQGKQSYFAIDFKRGDRIDDETIAKVVAPALRKVRDNCAAVDRARQERIVASATVVPAEPQGEREEAPQEGIAGTEGYSEVDINPEDIPF